MSDDNERLDRLLSAPLAPVADNGFSTRVMTKIATADAHYHWLENAVLAITAFILVAALSAAGFFDWIENVGLSLATSLPLAIAGLALTITWSYTRALAD